MSEDTQTAENQGGKKGKKTKEVASRRYWAGPKFGAPDTVFGAIRKFVFEKGEDGATDTEIVSYMLANFAPKKSANYGESYVRSYLRDAPKFEFLVTDADRRVTDLGQAVKKSKPSETGEASEPSMTEAGRKIVDAIKAVSNGTMDPIAEEAIGNQMNRPPKSLAKAFSKLINDGFLTKSSATEGDVTVTLYALTERGLNA